MPERIKTNLVAGFLGSGKTTLIRRYLERAGPRERVAVLLNEAGDEDLGPRARAASRVRVSELTGGCVCCQGSGEFSVALKTLAQFKPDRILIESTGIADPQRILQALSESPSLRSALSVEPTIVVVDAAGFFSLFQTLAYYYLLQLRAADVVVLNKADVATPTQLREAEREVAKLNPRALILRSRRGQVDLRGILEGTPTRGARGFAACTIALQGTVDPAGLRKVMEGLPDGVYRAKGNVRFPDGTHRVRYLTGAYALEPAGAPDGGHELVFIGSRLDERRLRSELRRCLLEDSHAN